MNALTLVFFGSFQSYSVQVLEKLSKNFTISAVVTTPPKPAGRHMQLKHTEVETFAETHALPVYSPENLNKFSLPTRPDFLVVVGYGKLIPDTWLNFPKIMAMNMHPSLLPNYRGPFPGEWAILNGEKESGVSLIRLTHEIDRGEIFAQQSIPIEPNDTRETLYKKLYDMGGTMLVEILAKIKTGAVQPTAQPLGEYFFARRITREDGFVPWKEFHQVLTENPMQLDIKFRAFTPWPGVWSTTPSNKRLKLIALKPQPIVQLEGKNPTPWDQVMRSFA